MRTIAIIQARMTSTRLPGKVLADLGGQPLLSFMLSRVRRAHRLDGVWVAITINGQDDSIATLCQDLGVPTFRGDEADVLGRYVGAAAAAGAETVVRLTADCPFADPLLIDEAVERFQDGGFDYLSNAIALTFPDGLDIEVFRRTALETADREARLPFHREHVTPYLRTGVYDDVPTGDFKVGHFRAPADFSHLRWTIDTPADLARVRRLAAHLPANFGWLDAIALLTRRPELLADHAAAGPAAAVSLRPARAADAKLLHEWVNRPESLAAKLKTTQAIPWERHLQWFESRLASPSCGIWIAESGGRPVGQVRAERDGESRFAVDIFVIPEARGTGVALAMLEALAAACAQRWPGAPLVARIKPDNWASRRLFAKAGYGGMTVNPDHLIFRRESGA
jgi:spore coat polysaccharide biosynthesis protein SpsF